MVHTPHKASTMASLAAHLWGVSKHTPASAEPPPHDFSAAYQPDETISRMSLVGGAVSRA